ncbi:MAG: T9SS type A sorting domain-containing protein [Ignavibacteriae bacterium]|nr:T9SS type A sorting domain-containing protein [Ignavibacteriota bacterium]
MKSVSILCLFISLIIVSEIAYSQWTEDPSVNTPVETNSNWNSAAFMCLDNDGGTIFMWSDWRNQGTSGIDVYAQKLNASGYVQWTTNGVPVCTASGDQEIAWHSSVGDGSGGAIITWRDKRNGNTDVYANRISATGIPLWGANGIPICTNASNQEEIRIAGDSAGGAIFVWQDDRNDLNDIYTQRVNQDGNIQWDLNGIPLCMAASWQINADMVSDGMNGAVVVWIDTRSGTDIYGQRVDSSGNLLWTAHGVAISQSVGSEWSPTINTTTNNNFVITYHDNRNGNQDVYSQKVNLSGVVQWATNGVAVCTTSQDQVFPYCVTDGEGGSIIQWWDFRNGVDNDIYAQRIDSNGTAQWQTNGLPICALAGEQYRQNIVSDGKGGAIIIWDDLRNSVRNIYAQRINRAGKTLWQSNGIFMCSASGDQWLGASISDGDGGVIANWWDFRGQTSIYAQRIISNGYLASPGMVAGTVFHDVNKNGIYDESDQTQSSWIVEMKDENGIVLNSTTSDSLGAYAFRYFLSAGIHVFSEVLQLNWRQTLPQANGNYSINLTYGEIYPNTDFGNSLNTNSLTVRKYQDTDADIMTKNDRISKKWYLELRQGSLTGSLVASGNSYSVSTSSLADGIYYVIEADSESWISLGYEINDITISNPENWVSVTLIGDDTVIVDFINAPPDYNQLYRTAKMEEWALAKDTKGKFKSLKKKADRVFFKFNLVADNTRNLILDFGMIATGAITRGKSKLDTLATFNAKKPTFNLMSQIATGESIQVEGIGYKGKLMKTKYAWGVAKAALVSSYKRNELGLPMPNYHNVGEEVFAQGAFPNGLVVGIPQGMKGANSVLHKKYADVQKSLVKSSKNTNLLHTMAARCLDSLDGTKKKPIDKQQKSLPPDKHNNKLFAEALTLELNIAASAGEKFPIGLGELTFDDTVANPFNGQTVSKISAMADSMLSCLPLVLISGETYDDLYSAIRIVNQAFSDTLVDTLSFASKTKFTGVKRLIDVYYLHVTPGLEPVPLASYDEQLSEKPEGFALYQNYPNPFNPTTVISYQLKVKSTVTLKVFDVLGRAVSTLLTEEVMDEGEYEIPFDASSLPSGVYYYRLNVETVNDDGMAENMTSVKKMILLR